MAGSAQWVLLVFVALALGFSTSSVQVWRAHSADLRFTAGMHAHRAGCAFGGDDCGDVRQAGKYRSHAAVFLEEVGQRVDLAGLVAHIWAAHTAFIYSDLQCRRCFDHRRQPAITQGARVRCAASSATDSRRQQSHSCHVLACASGCSQCGSGRCVRAHGRCVDGRPERRVSNARLRFARCGRLLPR